MCRAFECIYCGCESSIHAYNGLFIHCFFCHSSRAIFIWIYFDLCYNSFRICKQTERKKDTTQRNRVPKREREKKNRMSSDKHMSHIDKSLSIKKVFSVLDHIYRRIFHFIHSDSNKKKWQKLPAKMESHRKKVI